MIGLISARLFQKFVRYHTDMRAAWPHIQTEVYSVVATSVLELGS